MGRPYQSELNQLAATYRWASTLDTKPLADQIQALDQSSLLVIGSGGSQSTAQLLCDLHQHRFGQISRADTPPCGQQLFGKIQVVRDRPGERERKEL